MKPLKNKSVDDIEAGEIIVFYRTNKAGKTVPQLGLVNQVNADKNDRLESFEILPMVPSEIAPTLGDMRMFQIRDQRDLHYTGLDEAHIVYGMAVTVHHGDYIDGIVESLGYLEDSLANQVYDFADTAVEKHPEFFELTPNKLSGVNFPAMIMPDKDTPNRSKPSGMNKHPHSKYHQPGDAWVINGKDLRVTGLPENDGYGVPEP